MLATVACLPQWAERPKKHANNGKEEEKSNETRSHSNDEQWFLKICVGLLSFEFLCHDVANTEACRYQEYEKLDDCIDSVVVAHLDRESLL